MNDGHNDSHADTDGGCYKKKLISLMRTRPYFPLLCDNPYWDYMERWLEEQREKNPMYLATCCWTFVSYQKSNDHDKNTIFKLSEYGRGKSSQSNMKVFKRIAKENGFAGSKQIIIPAYNADHLEDEIKNALPPSKFFSAKISLWAGIHWVSLLYQNFMGKNFSGQKF
jgi:hypothetical protein